MNTQPNRPMPRITSATITLDWNARAYQPSRIVSRDVAADTTNGYADKRRYPYRRTTPSTTESIIAVPAEATGSNVR